MEDKLKKFITENREAFDFREPDPEVWKKVKAKIRVRHEIGWRVIITRAAAVLLIFAASYGANEWIHHIRNADTMDEKTGKASADHSIPGLQEAETYYTSLVNQKMDELKPIMANCPSLKEELNIDMSELDSVYLELKADLRDNMANQEVVEAIIENYRLKIRILEDLLTEMDPNEEECISNEDTHVL